MKHELLPPICSFSGTHSDGLDLVTLVCDTWSDVAGNGAHLQPLEPEQVVSIVSLVPCSTDLL